MADVIERALVKGFILFFMEVKAMQDVEKVQPASGKDGYESRLSLIGRAFSEISRLCFEYDYSLSKEDWRVLDEARLDDPALSIQELRERLARLYRRIKRACLDKRRSTDNGQTESKREI